MKRREWLSLLERAVAAVEAWEGQWPGHTVPPMTAEAERAITALVGRLGGSYPFFHPRYAGQLIKPPHPVAWVAYAATALINPNNHARDGGPPTTEMEVEVIADLAEMLGFGRDPTAHLGHLTGGGTVANLEALWVAHRHHPDRAIAFGANAHYTHARMCELIGARAVVLECDARGRIDADALARRLDRGDIGTVVATAATTGMGALDPIDAIADMVAARGIRLHIDAAYGGFFCLLARRDPPLCDPGPLLAVARADSVVVDPHKHGLQPYGCGCVIFRDPTVARFYVHDSPYTYFTGHDRHLGEISLECSRPGAAAAALWATLQAIPLEPEAGLGEILAASRRAALAWAGAIEASDRLRMVVAPDTDVLVFAPFPRGRSARATDISRWSNQLFDVASSRAEIYLAKYTLATDMLATCWPGAIDRDADQVTVLRSVLIKPDHESWWPTLHRDAEALAAEILPR